MFKNVIGPFLGFLGAILLFILTVFLMNIGNENIREKTHNSEIQKDVQIHQPQGKGIEVIEFKSVDWLKINLQVKDYDKQKEIKLYNVVEQGEYLYSPYAIGDFFVQEGIVEIDTLVCVIPKAPEIVYKDNRFTCDNGVCKDIKGQIVGIDKSVQINCRQ